MSRIQQRQIRWAKSWPTEVDSPIFEYTCSYERGLKVCKKKFPRQCDLRQHQKYHIRPSHCTKCPRRFASPKDLERHDTTIHNNTLKYFCPYAWCRDSIKLELEDWYVMGFRRKDHWLKHLSTEHSASKGEVKFVQKVGIPLGKLEGGTWIAVIPKPSTADGGLAGPSNGDVELVKGASQKT
ncbi:hypothetical protein BKA64DRAFT_656375 [Cadophora sp. MPI-SDFR-AT-0126]|nr:hypothetical protein BKA64DRAFT_656375 [Leotiomycetes sp. MPI-SDFR-AT-0126]